MDHIHRFFSAIFFFYSRNNFKLYGSVCFCGFFLFLFRQFLLIFVFFLLLFFEKELDKFSKDYAHITSLLYTVYPVLKLEFFLSILSIPAILTLTNSTFEKTFFYPVAALIFTAYFSVLTLRMFAIFTTSEVRHYFIPTRMKGSQTTRMYTTLTADAVVKLCVECTKFIGVGVVASYGVPKLFYGATYRSPVANFLGYYATGLKSNNELYYSAAVGLVGQDPSFKAQIVEDDGYTVSPTRWRKFMVDKKLLPELYGFPKQS